MYDIYVGKQRSIVFPIMCNAHINISYADNIVDFANNNDTTDDVPYGLWGHSGSFIYQAIFTPYDINGMGAEGFRGRSAQPNNQYIMPESGSPSTSISYRYMWLGDRLTHSMALFHNANFSVYLTNTTLTDNNQPAEYKIKVIMKIGGVNQTFETGTLIRPVMDKSWLKGNADNNFNYSGFDADGVLKYESVATLSSAFNAGGNSFPITMNGSRVNTATFFAGQKIFVRDGFNFIELGTISGASLPLTLQGNQVYNADIANGSEIYIEPFKEPKYVKNMHHVAVVHNEFDNKINIFYNRSLVLSTKHNTAGTFVFDKTDCLIGRTTTDGAITARNASQYMGEIHEMSLERGTRKNITYSNSLFPFYDDTLMYLRFEEVDE